MSSRQVKVRAVVARLRSFLGDVLARARRTRTGRAWELFRSVNGNLLAGGIAYTGLFSAFAALTVGWTGFMLVLGSDVRLRGSVLDTLSEALPGLIDTGDGRGALKPEDLLQRPELGWTGAIAVVGLLLSATSCLGALRAAVRAVFGITESAAVRGRLRVLATFALVGLLVLVSSVAQVAATSAVGRVLELVGMDSGWVGELTLRTVGVVVVLLIDMVTVGVVFVVLAGARPACRDLLLGTAVAAVAIGVVRQAGSLLVTGSSHNALLAPFAVVVTLLVTIDLIARFTLLAAALTATPPRVE